MSDFSRTISPKRCDVIGRTPAVCKQNGWVVLIQIYYKVNQFFRIISMFVNKQQLYVVTMQ